MPIRSWLVAELLAKARVVDHIDCIDVCAKPVRKLVTKIRKHRDCRFVGPCVYSLFANSE